MSEQLLSAAEASEILEVDRSTLIRWVEKGIVAAVQKLPGQTGAYLFEPAEIGRVLIMRKRTG